MKADVSFYILICLLVGFVGVVVFAVVLAAVLTKFCFLYNNKKHRASEAIVGCCSCCCTLAHCF